MWASVADKPLKNLVQVKVSSETTSGGSCKFRGWHWVYLLTFSLEPVVSEDSTTPDLDLPDDPDKLHELRDNVAMELLWTQQAIESRKKVSRSTIILFQTVMTLRRVFFLNKTQ